MPERGTYLRVGLLVVIGTAILVGLLLFLGGDRLTEGVKFETYFRESVQGLEVGAPVKYRGVTVGRVTDIGLVSAEYGMDATQDIRRATYRLVFVRFVIDPKRVGRMPNSDVAVKTGLRTRIAAQGLTGLAYVELDFVNPEVYPPEHVPWTPRTDYIPSMPSTLSQVQDAAQQVLARLNSVDFGQLAATLTGLMTDLRAELATGDTHRALVGAADLMATLQQQAQAADVPALTSELRQTAASIRTLAQGKETRELLANLNATVDRLSKASAQLPALVTSLNATVNRAGNGTADIQQSLVPLLRDMQATAANLRDTTELLRRYPAQVLLGGPPPRGAVP